MWGLATTSSCRRSLADLDVIPTIVGAIKRSLKLTPIPNPEPGVADQDDLDSPEGTVTESLRATFQRHLIGALAMLLVDRCCRWGLDHIMVIRSR